METNTLTRRTSDGYDRYDCAVNAFSVDDLFSAYQRSRFLYAEKMQRLAPHWAAISNSWERSQRGGELLHYTVSHGDLRGDDWASLTSWRSTHNGWLTQHLVSTGGRVGSRAVMLAAQAVRIRDGWDNAHQNWFRPNNRFAALAFGGMVRTLPEGTAAVHPGGYFAVPRRRLCPSYTPAGVSVSPLGGEWCADLERLARSCRGEVYVVAEELDGPDLLLDEVDQLYRLVGLRRYRRIWLAQNREGVPLGAAIVYRGPLGMNFSFLENRCDLLLSPRCPDAVAKETAAGLLARAAAAYDDWPLDHLLVTCDEGSLGVLEALGGRLVQPYSQSIWLSGGFEGWYRHIESLYAQAARRAERSA